MAIYHCSIKNIGRSNGRSAVACSAYRAAQKLRDKETGLLYDFTRKPEVIYSKIFLCKNAPAAYADRETLWNEVQKIETPTSVFSNIPLLITPALRYL